MSSITDRRCSCGARLARDNPGTMCSACQRNKRRHFDAPPTLPADFWSAEPIQRSLHEWHMGRLIAAYRTHPYHHRPLPQEQVARWLGITQAQLSRIENGEPINDLAKLTDWATLLGIPSQLLWFKLPGSGSIGGPSPEDGESPPVHVSRLAEKAAAGSMHFARTTAETGLAAEAIDHLRWEVERLAVDYVHVPLHIVFGELLTVRDTVFELLSKRHRPRDARQLYQVAGIVCNLLGLGSLDSCNHRAARSQLRAAWTCAQMSDDDDLRAWIQGTAATNEEWAGRPDRSIEHAARGLTFNPAYTSNVRLTALLARGTARLGDSEGATEGLEKLQRAQDLPRRTDSLSLLGGAYDFPDAKQRFYIGGTQYLIGHHDAAEQSARSAVEIYRNGPADERSYGDQSLAQVDILNARISAGDLDGADEAVKPLVDLPVAKRIGPLFTALRETHALLEAPSLAGVRTANSLREQLTSYEDETFRHGGELLASPA